MKKLIPLVMLLTAQAFGGVQQGSAWPEDALLISDLIEARLHRTCIVSLDGPDSALVAFISLGGEWTSSDYNWYDLIFVYAVASSVDMEKSWSISDLAVSFGPDWCLVRMDDVFALSSDSVLTEEEWWTELKSLTEVHIRE
jgi:hypothetical protein